jgi:hypothetical protein
MGCFKKFRKNRVIVWNFDTGWEFPWYRPKDRKYFLAGEKWLFRIVTANHSLFSDQTITYDYFF